MYLHNFRRSVKGLSVKRMYLLCNIVITTVIMYINFIFTHYHTYVCVCMWRCSCGGTLCCAVKGYYCTVCSTTDSEAGAAEVLGVSTSYTCDCTTHWPSHVSLTCVCILYVHRESYCCAMWVVILINGFLYNTAPAWSTYKIPFQKTID